MRVKHLSSLYCTSFLFIWCWVWTSNIFFKQTASVSILGKPYCYFNSDFQGNFTTQVPYDNFIDEVEENQLDFHYSRVEIELDRIPVWGECHRKLGENYILAMRQVNFWLKRRMCNNDWHATSNKKKKEISSLLNNRCYMQCRCPMSGLHRHCRKLGCIHWHVLKKS